MINISTKTINPAARYRVTMTDPIDGSAEKRIMIGADLKQTAYAIGHLYDINAELIPDTKQGTQTPDTAETEQDAETAPAAEPETETAETIETTETAPAAETETETAETAEPEQAERDARIADILDAVRREIVAGYYRRKQRVTARCIREAERAGAPTVYVGYCDAQYLLGYCAPDYYTAGIYGWNCDIYRIAGLTICTGYRGMVGEPAVLTADYERRARAAASENERDAILAEWIAANLDTIQATREGARA